MPATVVTLHQGGRNPKERAELTQRAADALEAMVEAMEPTDVLKHPCSVLAACLALRARFEGRRA